MEKNVKIEVVEHRRTGLMVAMSKDLRGLMVHGRTGDELDERIPEAIRSLMEAEGHRVESVVKVDDDHQSSAFRPATSHYEAALAA
jgi:hypothetical protein